MKGEERQEVRWSAEILMDLFLHMQNALERTGVRTRAHSRKIAGQPVVVDDGRNGPSLRFTKQSHYVVAELAIRRDSTLEARTVLHAFRDQKARIEEEIESVELGSKNIFDESLLRLSFDKNKHRLHGRAPRTFFSQRSPRA